MKNLVGNLNAWLSLYTQRLQHNHLDEMDRLESEEALSKICKEAKMALRTLVFGKHSRQRVALRIRHWQHELSLWVNELPGKDMDERLRQLLTAAMLDLCAHLEQHYPIFFNLDGLMPKPLVEQVKKKLVNEMPLLRAALKQRKISEELATLILDAFGKLENVVDYSYRQWRFWAFLLPNLIKFCREIANGELQWLLLEHLIYLRFDSMALYHFLKNTIKEQTAGCFDPNEQYDLLFAFKKRLAVQQEHQGFLQQEVGLGLKKLLLDFVLEELAYLERRPKEVPSQTFTKSEQYRVHLGISVDALAYLLRLSIAVGLINANPKSTFLVFIAKYFQTPGIGEAMISVNSLQTKYKQVVQHTAFKVRALLRRMIKEIEAEFDLG